MATETPGEREFLDWFADFRVDHSGNDDDLWWLEQAWLAGRAAEREAIIATAARLHATVPADHPKGALASFADYLRVTGDTDGN